MTEDDPLPDLFLSAVELDADGRRALLDRLRPREPALVEELERLLAAPATATSPIDDSPREALEISAAEGAVTAQVGPYRIVRQLGEGGMGRVYLAEHATPDFSRFVALKLIAQPGPDEQAVRRFRDEVRILAALDHPGIVRFLDGGRSPEGVWFLAQEYVSGDHLVDHARRHELTVTQRVVLFRAVLEATAAAHARGVVHRDLKPANVLVGADGRPRLVDFGISKLADPTTGAGNLSTQTEARALTPAYASPEQLAGRAATAASDLYSLGVILYELLVGDRPFAAAGSSREVLEREVLLRDPEAPSSAARRRARTTTTLARGAAPPPRAGRELGPDLDAICLKALRKEPGERYASAAAFAEDLQRWLDGQPVAARRGGRRYRASRFVRRYRARLTTAAALVLAAASIVVALQLHRESRARAVPPQVFPFSHLRTMPIEELEQRFVAAPEDVAAGAALALGLLGKGRSQEAQILIERLRQIPGGGDDPLIDYAEASIAQEGAEHQRALVLFTRARDGALRRRRGELLAQVRAARGSTLLLLGQPAAAAEEMQLAIADFERAGDDASLGRVLGDLAVVHLHGGDFARGEELLARSVVAADRAGARPIAALCNLAQLAQLRGRPDLAAPRLQRVVGLYRQSGEAQKQAYRASELAQVLRDLGEKAPAERLLADAVGVLERAEKPSPALATSLFRLAVADLAAARSVGTPTVIERIEGVAEAAADTRGAALAHHLRGRLAALRGDAQATAHFAEARRLLVTGGAADLAAELDLAWADAERAAGRLDETLRVLDLSPPQLADPAASTIGFFSETLRARVDLARGNPTAARRRLAGLGDDAARSPSLSRRFAFLAARALLALAEDRPADAAADLASARAVAERLGHDVERLQLLVDAAELARDAATRGELATEAEREATRLALPHLAERARRVATSSPLRSA